jgi:hypothetical protein
MNPPTVPHPRDIDKGIHGDEVIAVKHPPLTRGLPAVGELHTGMGRRVPTAIQPSKNAHKGPPGPGQYGPKTHAALVGAAETPRTSSRTRQPARRRNSSPGPRLPRTHPAREGQQVDTGRKPHPRRPLRPQQHDLQPRWPQRERPNGETPLRLQGHRRLPPPRPLRVLAAASSP